MGRSIRAALQTMTSKERSVLKVKFASAEARVREAAVLVARAPSDPVALAAFSTANDGLKRILDELGVDVFATGDEDRLLEPHEVANLDILIRIQQDELDQQEALQEVDDALAAWDAAPSQESDERLERARARLEELRLRAVADTQRTAANLAGGKTASGNRTSRRAARRRR